MKFESDLEIKHIETLAQSLQKAKFDGITLLESITLTRALEFVLTQIKIAKTPKPVGVISAEEMNKKVTPISSPRKKK